ncbi:helix-turn-helix domain-containing protein [Candidatus Enterococcus ferrettii]|nr:helix-turn-helix transcriptional regulator [Enterococcus sp. 665A]MBO1340937.1 helix-turn-helix transcriptional regulator [Enterococcus sp. 665A]
MDIKYFSDKLKAVRKSKKMTQSDLAEKIGVSKWAITSYEQARTYPSVETLMKICEALNTSSDYLLGISDNLPTKLSLVGLSEEEVRLLLQFLNLVEQNRNSKK